MLSRRNFLKLSIAGGAATYVATRGGFMKAGMAAQSPRVPLNAKSLPQFVDAVPNLLATESLIVDDGATQIDLEMREQVCNVLPIGAVAGYTGTRVWSYLKPGQSNRTSYLGPVILAHRGIPTQIKFTNQLGDSSNAIDAYRYSTDQSLHWANPEGNMYAHMAGIATYNTARAENYLGSIPAVPHLHGGYVPPVLDGGPDAWFLSDGSKVGAGYYSMDGTAPKNYCIYRYPNDQEGTLIWFHDHTLGATRLNVYCGLAGAHLIVDPADTLFGNLPELVPLVIQDRMFDTNGQLFFPADSAGGVLWALNPQHPYWVPEFIGDVICVNGKSWPYMKVDEKRYTFMIINGSNARTYEFYLIDPISNNFGPPLWVIATDGGYLDVPAKIDPAAATNNRMVMMPGERYWIIVDFAGYSQGVKGPNGSRYSGKWLLRNSAKAPYPGGTSPQGSTTARIMQFVVTKGTVTDGSYNPASGAPLRPTMIRLSTAMATKTRQLTLNEIAMPPQTAIDPVTGVMTKYPGGPTEILVNNTKWTGERITGIDPNTMMYMSEPIDSSWPADNAGNLLSEVPTEGETEIWEIVNTTMDAHPIHTHLAQFQLLSRQAYDAKKYFNAYSAAFTGGFDFTTGLQALAGVFVPAWGPPLKYNDLLGGKIGGNPDVTPFLKGAAQGPLPQEYGWKDTVMAPPGMVTRFIVRWGPQSLPANTPATQATLPFDPAVLGGGYVWHCHIVDHEDNEMMRPDKITPQAGATRTYIIGTNY
jgi:spore coat protein A